MNFSTVKKREIHFLIPGRRAGWHGINTIAAWRRASCPNDLSKTFVAKKKALSKHIDAADKSNGERGT